MQRLLTAMMSDANDISSHRALLSHRALRVSACAMGCGESSAWPLTLGFQPTADTRERPLALARDSALYVPGYRVQHRAGIPVENYTSYCNVGVSNLAPWYRQERLGNALQLFSQD
jgi:hypothetical protein